MKTIQRLLPIIVAATTLLAACEDSPVNPLTDTMSATVNGTAWNALLASSASAGGVTTVTGTRSVTSLNELLSIELVGISAPGTYSIGGVSTAIGLFRRDTLTYRTSVSQLVPAGTITITQYDAARIAGTFSFTAYRDGDRDTNDSVVVSNGAFSVKRN